MNILSDKELINIINNLVEEKIKINKEFLRFSFYEVMIKEKIPERQENDFLQLARTKLTNIGYSVFVNRQEYVYNDVKMKVQINELLIAIKK